MREPVLSLLLAVQSHAIVPTAESMTALLRTTNALPLERLHEHGQRWFTLAVRPGSDELVLGDGRGGVYRTTPDQPALGEIAAPSERAILSAASALALSADGQAIASGGYGGIITVRRDADARKLDTEETHEVFITALAFSPDSRSLASAATGGRLLLHDLASGRHRTIDTAGVDLSRVAFSPDGRLLVAGGDHVTRMSGFPQTESFCQRILWGRKQPLDSR